MTNKTQGGGRENRSCLRQAEGVKKKKKEFLHSEECSVWKAVHTQTKRQKTNTGQSRKRDLEAGKGSIFTAVLWPNSTFFLTHILQA